MFLYIKIFLIVFNIIFMNIMTTNANNTEMENIFSSQNVFAKNIFKSVSGTSDGNIFFSPFNIATALSMLYIGSEGNTENELKSVLNITLEKSSIGKEYHRLLTELKTLQSEFELNSANMLFTSLRYSILEAFLTSVFSDFMGSITPVDFKAKKNARTEINRAVESATHSKIKDLIPHDFITKETRLVLVNIIYFKGLWMHPFKTSDTEIMPFWINEHRSVQVPMMTTKNYFQLEHNYESKYTLLALDYLGERLYFVILLPDDINSLKNVESNLLEEDFKFLESDLSKVEVKVTIPKLKMEETIDLVDTLASLGISDLFSEEFCDLSGISGRKDLFVSKALHKAYIEVDEVGTEAAAATVSNVRLKRSLDIPETFIADRPFVFLIYDKTLRTILFMGRYVFPPSTTTFKDEL